MGLLHGSLKHTMEEFQQIKNSGSETGADQKKEQPEDWEPEEDLPRTSNGLAMFLAALIVVLPVILLAAGLMLLAFWLFV